MTRTHLRCLLLIGLALPAMAAKPVPVKNASFEDATVQADGPVAEGWETGGAPPGWHHWIGSTALAGKPVLTWERTGGREGGRCVSLSGCVGTVCVIQSVPVEPGRGYQVRVWARVSAAKGECYATVRWQDKAGKWMSGQTDMRLPAGARPESWHELETQVSPPVGAGLAVLLLTATGQAPGAKCSFDDVSVLEMEAGDVAVASCDWMHPNLFPEGEPPETPHVRWAKPWARGRLRALFLLGSDHSLREPVEVAQRLDCDYDYTFAHDFEEALFALNHKEVRRRIEAGAYDVIVVGIRASEALSRTLLDRAGAKGGVVFLSSPQVSPAIPRDVKLRRVTKGHYLDLGLRALPPYYDIVNVAGKASGTATVSAIETAEGAPGRVVRIAYSEPFRCLTPNLAYEDYLRAGAGQWEGYLQMVLRAMLWASRKAPADPARIERAPGGAELVAWVLPGEKVACRTWVTDRMDRQLGERSMRLDPGEQRVTIPLPAAAASGDVAYSALLTDEKGGVLDFASAVIQPSVESARKSRIEGVQPEKPYFLEDEPIRVAVATAGAAGMEVEVRLYDIHGRQAALVTAPVSAGDTVVTLEMRDHFSTFNLVRARLLQGEREIDAARCVLLAPVPRRPFLEDFQIGTWASTGYHPAYLHDAMVQTMKRAAITEGLEAPGAMLATLAGGIWPVSLAYGMPGFTRFPGPGTVRRPCLSDPEVRRQMAEKAEETARKELGIRPIFGYLADETSLVKDSLDLDTCSCEHCAARYREWLRERYPSLDALNAQWRTRYASWEEIGFVDYRQARKEGNLAPWLMFRRFMDWTWAEGVRWASKHARKADPTAMLALANSFGLNAFSGRDYRLLLDANDYTMEYPYDSFTVSPVHHHFEAVRSFAAEKVHHPWIGYVFSDEAIHFDPWWSALHGAGGLEIYGCMSLFAGKDSWAQVFPTMQLTRRGRMYAEIVKPLKEGVGKALMSARRLPADVAILWSQPSLYVAWGMCGQESLGQALNTQTAYRQLFYSSFLFRRAVEATGRQFDYVSEEQIREGILDRYRCLVLPAAFALGPETCARLEAFVERGGRLIADQGVGLASETGIFHGADGPAFRLFGIRRRGRDLGYDEAKVRGVLPDGTLLELQASGHEKLESVPGASTYPDGSPMVVARRQGKGETVFLNCAFADVPGLRALFRGLPVLATLAAPDGGEAPGGYEVVRLDRGPIQYLGVLHDYRFNEGDLPVALKLPEPRHVYDALAGKYLGHTDRITPVLPPGRTGLYASLPYAVAGVAASGSGHARPGETYRLSLAVRGEGTLGDHVLRVAVTGPSGQASEAYSRNVLTVAGRAEVAIPFAPNDAPGAWRVEASDIASGKLAAHVVRLQP